MRRAKLERRRTVREWKARLPRDGHLPPGRFRKGRRARGCASVCSYCRDKKLSPTRQEMLAAMELAEGVEALPCMRETAPRGAANPRQRPASRRHTIFCPVWRLA